MVPERRDERPGWASNAEDTSLAARRLPGLVKRKGRSSPISRAARRRSESVRRSAGDATPRVHTRRRVGPRARPHTARCPIRHPVGSSARAGRRETVITAPPRRRLVSATPRMPSGRGRRRRASACSRAATSRSGAAAAASSSSSATAPAAAGPPSRTGAGHPALQHAVALQQLDPQPAAAPAARAASAASSRRRSASSRAEPPVRIGQQRPRLGEPAGRACARAPPRTGRRRAPTPRHPGAAAAAARPTRGARRRPPPRAGRGPSTRSAPPAGATSASASTSPWHRRDQLVRPRRRGPGAAGRPARWGCCRRP